MVSMLKKTWTVIAVYLLIVLLSASLVTARLVTTTVASGVVASQSSPTALTNCDGVGTFFCPTGTCYTGYDGYVGCCTVANCAARTTCIPYTNGVSQSCGPDTGGCVTCTESLPDCVTISNVVNSQYIMYCDKQAHVETLSYSNLVTTGSMALLPSQTTHHPTASATSTAAPKSTSDGSFIPTDSSDEPQGSPWTPNVAIIFACIVAAGSLGIVLFMIYRGRFRVWRNRVRAFIASHVRLPRHRIADASRQNNHNLNAMAPRGRANISTTNAMHPNDYLSPISRDRMARQAEARDVQAEELESIQAPVELERPGRQPEADWLDSTSYSRKSANPSSRWSASNIPVSFQQRQLNRERRFNSLNDMLIAADRPAFEHPDASVDSLISPLIGDVSPLMGSDARASVGEPPVRRGSITHCTPTKIRHSWARARCDSPLFGEPGTATSYTRGLPFLTPEQELEREKRIEAATACTKKAGTAEDNTGEAAGGEKAIAELSDAEIGRAEAAQHDAGSLE